MNDEAIADASLRKKRKGKEHAVARTGVGEVRKAAKESFAGPKKAIGETSKCWDLQKKVKVICLVFECHVSWFASDFFFETLSFMICMYGCYVVVI